MKTIIDITRLLYHCLAVILTASLLVLLYAQPVRAAETSGTCGESISWELTDGVLKISGSGYMTDYDQANLPPWYELRESITQLKIEGAVLNIGDFAFYQCENLVQASIPDSILEIGSYAFFACESMNSIQLGTQIRSIGEYAFESCRALPSITLPDTLTSIGNNAFFRCTSLVTITIPESVTSLGSAVFAHCSSMVEATVNAYITELPHWTFYGCDALKTVTLSFTVTNLNEYAFKECDNLKSVYYLGSMSDADKITEQIQADVPKFKDVTQSLKPQTDTPVSSTVKTESGGTVTDTRVDVIQNQHGIVTGTQKLETPGKSAGSISQTTQGGTSQGGTSQGGTSQGGTSQDGAFQGGTSQEGTSQGGASQGSTGRGSTSGSTGAQDTVQPSYNFTVNATLTDIEGWQGVVDQILTYADMQERVAFAGVNVSRITAEIYLKNDIKLPSKTLNQLAGKNALLNIHTTKGALWTIDCNQLSAGPANSEYDLSFQLTTLKEPSAQQKELLQGAVAYTLSFAQEIPYKLSVQIPLGSSYAGSYATIFQRALTAPWEKLQTMLIDGTGNTFFYLENVDNLTTYMIGINVPGISAEEIMVPDNMSGEYGGLTDELGNKYVVTGAKSSWGMTLGQVMGILAAILIGCMVAIGGVMWLVLKRKATKAQLLKQWEEEYDKKHGISKA